MSRIVGKCFFCKELIYEKDIKVDYNKPFHKWCFKSFKKHKSKKLSEINGK